MHAKYFWHAIVISVRVEVRDCELSHCMTEMVKVVNNS